MRKRNFSGGPGELPPGVLEQAACAVEELDGTGVSILGLSHRSEAFARIVAETIENIRVLAGVPAEYEVLLLQGGGTLQFSMAAMHLGRPERAASFVVSGYWSDRVAEEARRVTTVAVAWNGRSGGFSRVPPAVELDVPEDASLFHYVSNETVEGVQFHSVPGPSAVPRIADMSSDFLSRPSDVAAHAIIYAHAQKNLGPAGVTIVIARRDVIDSGPTAIPEVLQYRAHAAMGSIYQTPPVFAIYVVLLVTRWMLAEGGTAAIGDRNARKAASLYATLDRQGAFYRLHAEPASRSLMNVTFRTPSPELDARLARLADEAGLTGLGGHRSLGGLRASIYNAVTLESVAELCGFLDDFARRHG